MEALRPIGDLKMKSGIANALTCTQKPLYDEIENKLSFSRGTDNIDYQHLCTGQPAVSREYMTHLFSQQVHKTHRRYDHLE